MNIEEDLARVLAAREKWRDISNVEPDADKVRDALEDYDQACGDFVMNNLDAIKSALADQRRYRFLRDLPEEYRETDWLWRYSGESLDAAIDEASTTLAKEEN